MLGCLAWCNDAKQTQGEVTSPWAFLCNSEILLEVRQCRFLSAKTTCALSK